MPQLPQAIADQCRWRRVDHRRAQSRDVARPALLAINPFSLMQLEMVRMSAHWQTTIVLGLGSSLYSDEGVAIRATEYLRNDPRLPKGIVVIDRAALGLELLPELWDCARLVILTAVDAGAPPGTLVQLRGEQLHELDKNANRTQFAIASLYQALLLLANKPPEVTLFGVQAQSTSRGSMLSSAVDRAVPSLVENVIAELRMRGGLPAMAPP